MLASMVKTCWMKNAPYPDILHYFELKLCDRLATLDGFVFSGSFSEHSGLVTTYSFLRLHAALPEVASLHENQSLRQPARLTK
jgi:hypothetical protein